jgi:septal ring factor EnvC (AmiA/AmiB activator)
MYLKFMKYFSLVNLIACLFFLIILSASLNSTEVLAASPVNKLSDIQDKLKTKFKEVKEAREKEKSLLSKLGNLDKSIGKREKELKGYDKRISQTQANIKNLSKEIKAMTNELDSRKQYLKEVVMDIYKRQYKSNALVLLSASDYQDLITKSRYISLIAHYDSNLITSYSSKINNLNSKKSKLQAQQNELAANKKDAQIKTKELQVNRAKKDKLLAKVKAKRSAHEKKIKELEESSRKVKSMIARIKTKKIPAAVLGKGFKSLKGSLPWPVAGEVLIPFGKYKEPEFNTTVFKNGIEIGTKPEDIPQTIAGGRVVYTGQFEGYGNMVIIDHGGGYHSLYGNLSEILLKKGNIVVKGFEVGKISRSGNSDIPALYFEIRHKGKPVDPRGWLDR